MTPNIAFSAGSARGNTSQALIGTGLANLIASVVIVVFDA